jgi:uncharacterized protein with HEPN domain
MREYRLYISEILESISDIQEFVAGMDFVDFNYW